nr:phosphate signaling complex protein PhoU [Orrella marina]
MELNDHTYKQFDIELDEIRSDFLQMGGCVQSMIADAMEVLATGDAECFERVKENEKQVNQLELDIDDRITTMLARRQPLGFDLRLLLAVTKMLTDMERCGDEAERIAVLGRRMHEDAQKFVPEMELQHVATAVLGMLHDVMDSFARHDSVLAASVVRGDKKVDKEWKAAMRGLITYMIEDPRMITGSIDLMLMSRSLGRIGDHCKNMAERVIFMVHGKDVRHQGAKAAERLVKKATRHISAMQAPTSAATESISTPDATTAADASTPDVSQEVKPESGSQS